MTHPAHDHESHHRSAGRTRALLAASLLLAAGALFGSTAARAEPAGGETDGDASHGGIYESQRGPAGCDVRGACGGPAVIPTDLPGYRYTAGRTPLPKRR